jgi:hypothetical protein
MQKIDTTQIVDPTSLQPFTGRSLEFLQDSLDIDKAGIIKAFITQTVGSYSLTVPYVISGCVVSDSGKDVTAGEIFYGGKFYETTAVNGATNVARFMLTKTQDATADPVDFSNGASKNVHDIYKYVPTDVGSGGDFTSAALVSAYGTGKITSQINDGNQITTSTSYVNLGTSAYTTPNDGKTRTWLIIAKSVIKIDTVLGSTYNGGGIQLWNGVSSLDESYSFADLTGTTTELALQTAACNYVGSIPPNTTISMRMKSSGGGSTDFDLNSFTMIEL